MISDPSLTQLAGTQVFRQASLPQESLMAAFLIRSFALVAGVGWLFLSAHTSRLWGLLGLAGPAADETTNL